MNPEFIDGMSWEMAEVYGAITDQILINLAKYFPYYKTGGKVPKSAFTYQASMLAQMGQVNRETMAIIRNGLVDADDALKGVLEQAIIDSVSKAETPLLNAVKAGIFAPPTTPIVTPTQMRAFQLYYGQACDKLNLVNTVMLESTRSAYQQAVSDVVSEIELADRLNRTQIAIDTAAGETLTGVSSWNQAVKHATDRMKQGGITGFIDHAGRHWSAEAYTAMDIRTTVANTARAATWETNEHFGNDLYIVSWHSGARPGCYDWQNKVISRTDTSREVADLDGNSVHVYAQSETTYGQAAGLFGINCKHYPNPFIPGVSIIRGEPEPPEVNERHYQESQEQRRLERKLREEKRDVLMAKAQGAPEEEIKALQAKARQTSSDINDFCESTGRARHRDREAVYTKRDFPSKDTYDVGKFEQAQRDKTRQFFQSGGAQQQYNAGVMTPKTPLVPNTPPATPAPATPAATPATPTSAQPAFTPGVRNVKTFGEYKTYMRDTYGIDVTAGVKKLDFGLVKNATEGFETVVHDFPEVANGVQKIRLSKSGVMSCNGGMISFNSDYFTDPNELAGAIRYAEKSGWWRPNQSAASIMAHETAHGLEMVLINKSGKYKTPAARVLAWNNCLEARDIVKEACEMIMKTPAGKGKTAFEIIKDGVSRYGAKGGNSETMAEAFADVYANGENATELAKAIYEVTKRKYAQYMGGVK